MLETLPAAIDDVEFSVSEGAYDADTGEWTGVTLGVGETVTLWVSAMVDADATGTITNTVEVQPVGYADPDTSNNSDDDTDDLDQVVNLSLTKDLMAPMSAGEQATYEIFVENAGPSLATQVRVVDRLPVGLTYVSAAGDGWSCTMAGSDVTCTYADSLAAGEGAGFELVAAVAVTARGTISNTATVFSAEADAVPADDTDVASGGVTAPPQDEPLADLAFTGSEAARRAVLAMAMLALGSLLLLVDRRLRRP